MIGRCIFSSVGRRRRSMRQRGAGAAAGEDAPATHARRRTARPAGSDAQHLGLTAQPRVTAAGPPLEGRPQMSGEPRGRLPGRDLRWLLVLVQRGSGADCAVASM